MLTTRRSFLAAASFGVLALILGRTLRYLGNPPTAVGVATPRRADNIQEQTSVAGVELRPTPVDPNGPVFHLNRSAAMIWRNVDGRRTVTQLAGLLGAAYGLPAAQASADTIACLETLAAHGLVFDVPLAGAQEETQPT